MTIPQISEEEGLSQHYVAKLCRILRMGGYINSSRGKEGGYSLAIPADRVNLTSILNLLGGRLYTPGFCKDHPGLLKNCTHSVDCTVRGLWQILQQSVDDILDNMTLANLLGTHSDTAHAGNNHPETVLAGPELQEQTVSD